MPAADHGLRPYAESPQRNFVSKHPQVTALLKAAAVAMCIGSLAFTTNALADGDAASTGWNGTAGAGPLVFPKYVGGKQTKAWLIPLLSINYNDTYYIELQRAGVYLLASDDKKIGLGFAIEPRFGYATTDGNLLRGMSTRRTSIEGGPTFDWDFDVVAISIAWFGDLNRSSHGQSARVAAYAPILKNDIWDAGVLLSADRMSARVTDYYFGVAANETTTQRPQYRAGIGTNVALGLSGTYRLDKRHCLMFGMSTTRLSREATKSPIVETRRADQLYLGYGWTL